MAARAYSSGEIAARGEAIYREQIQSRKALNKGLPNCFSDYQELQ